MRGSHEIPRFQLLRDETTFLEQTESWGVSLFPAFKQEKRMHSLAAMTFFPPITPQSLSTPSHSPHPALH